MAGASDDVLRVAFVCSGNICRSPMGESVLREFVTRAGLSGRVVVSSAGVGDWHIGERADVRTLAALDRRGYDASRHRARLFEPEWFDVSDLVVALDRGHERVLRAWARTEGARDKVVLLRRFDPAAGDAAGRDLDIPDPYYDDDAFEDVLDQVEAACRGLVAHLGRLVAAGVTAR
ncbi:MAG: low molecular weight protein-tyrosine-phosphatase [Kineosporiaceae bacterium]